MLIPLKLAQFKHHLLIAGQTFNKIVDPSVSKKEVQLYGSELGVIVQLDAIEQFIPWDNISNAEAADGYSFLALFDDAKAKRKAAV